MGEIRNADLISNLIQSLFFVSGRRTLYSNAHHVITTSILKLQNDFPFLKSILIHESTFSIGDVDVTVDPLVEAIEPTDIAEACDAIIRTVYSDLLESTGDDIGLYFITELKEHLGDQLVNTFQEYGLKFEKIQSELHLKYRHREKQKPQPPKPPEAPKQDKPPLDYTWDTVSTWKYDDNLCYLYKENGGLLDTLQLDMVIEDYIIRISAPKDAPKPIESTMITIAEKDIKFLELLHKQDMDMKLAIGLLHVSNQKFEALINKLIHLEMLQYISENEMKLTEKGISFLSEIKKETRNTTRDNTQTTQT